MRGSCRKKASPSGAAGGTVTPEVPAYPDRGIKAVWAVRIEVGRAEVIAVASQPIHLVLRKTNFEAAGQLEADANGTVVRHGFHGVGVFQLRDIVAEGEFWIEEKVEMADKGAVEGLKFEVATEEIAAVGSALGIDAAGRGGLREGTAAEVRLVVRAGEIEINVAANPIVGEPGRGFWLGGRADIYSRRRGLRTDGEGYGARQMKPKRQ